MGIKSFFTNIYRSHVNNVAKAEARIFNDNLRPVEELGIGPRVNQQFFNPVTIVNQYMLSFYSDVLTTIHLALRRETFRNGFELVDAESADSENQTGEQGYSNESAHKEFLKWSKDVNENGQSMKDVLKECEDDLNTTDDMFLGFMNDYGFNANGEIVDFKLNEMIRLHPALMEFVVNKQEIPGFDDEGNEILACPVHRTEVHALNPDAPETHRCPKCQKKMYRVHFRHHGSPDKYYFKKEIFHMSRYRPSKTKGFSPINTIWIKQQTLRGQDEYIYELYQGKRPPKSMLIFNTSNQDTLKKAWKAMLEKAKENRHLPAILGLENNQPGSKQVAQFFDFMRSLDELNFIDQRNEYRNAIGAVYGVSPIWQNDVSASGGLNNEGMQITVSNRTIESNQSDYNDKCLPAILEAKGLKNSILKCRPSEEQDEMAKHERAGKSLENGEKAVKLGLKARYDKSLGEVIIEDGELEKPAAPDFGGGNPFGGNDDENPDDNQDDEGAPDDDTDGQSGRPNDDFEILKSVKKNLPAEAVALKPGQSAPGNSRVITGPKGGKYYVPAGGDSPP